MSAQLQVGDNLLTAYFQRYRVEDDLSSMAGELLTKLEGDSRPESYFSSLSLADQFAILEWHLQLSRELAIERDIGVSINVHNSLVEHEEDRRRFVDLLARYQHPVTLEFTESYPMPRVTIANALLREIRELGHLSALDDFGTGHNRMSLLIDFDFDVVKIDRSLSASVALNPERQRLMTLLFQYLEVLGKDHVVEGVEDESVHRLLVDAGFTKFQGFLFHRPVPVAGVLNISFDGADR